MDCREIRKALNQFVDDELEAERSFDYRRHTDALGEFVRRAQ